MQGTRPHRRNEMTTAEILQRIVAQLTHDLDVLFTAAKSAHAAAIHEENQPDNKYDTLALEASYVAQGQANRAQELRRSLDIYKQLKLPETGNDTVRLGSLVTLDDENGDSRHVFIGPAEGGMKISIDNNEIVVITPVSPLGRELIGRTIGDIVEIETGTSRTEYEIVALG